MTDPAVLDRRSVPLVFVESLTAPQLTESDWRHLSGSLRLRSGARLTVSDGAGGWRPAVLADQSLEPAGPVVVDAAPAPRLTVGFTPVKATKPEVTVAALVELGVDEIVVLETERSVVRWSGERATTQHRRWVGAATQAAMQCRSVWLPRVTGPISFDQFVDAHDRTGFALAEPGADTPCVEATTVIVGPEGGWSRSELAGKPTVNLPGRILRAGTAAVVAGTMLVNRHR